MVYIPVHIVVQMLSHIATLKLALAKEFGLSHFQFLTLVLVGSNDRLPIKELKRKLPAPGSSLTFTLDSLEKKKLIKRHRSKEDRRQWLLSLSSKGRQLYQEILKAEGEAILPTLEKLSEAEKATFLKIAQGIMESGIRSRGDK